MTTRETMMAREQTDPTVPLSVRLRQRAAAMQPDKPQPIIRRIVEVRTVLAEQRRRGLSWAALTDLLGAEGVHVSAGTLRNYMRRIGQVENDLREVDNTTPSDAEIHAALHRPPTRPPIPVRRHSGPHAQKEASHLPPSAVTGETRSPDISVARTSLVRNPDREL